MRFGCWAVAVLVFTISGLCALAQSESSPPAQASGAKNADASTSTTLAGDSSELELVKKVKPVYPKEAILEGIQGQVWLKVMISETGEVEKTEVVSGNPILGRAAMDAVKQWRYKPFIQDGHAIKVTTKVPVNFAFSDKVLDRKDLDAMTRSSGENTPKRVSLPAGLSQGLLLHAVKPVYPPAARALRVQGSVVLKAIIGKDGRIHELTPVNGPRELVAAAVGAVQQWRYKPYTLDGEPLEVETQITVNFELH